MTKTLCYSQLLRQRGVPEVLLAACLSRLAGRTVTLAIVSQIVLRTLDNLKMPHPKISDACRHELLKIRKGLEK